MKEKAFVNVDMELKMLLFGTSAFAIAYLFLPRHTYIVGAQLSQALDIA